MSGAHPYHLVKPSYWPLLGAIAGGCLTLGGVLALHDRGQWLWPIGVALTLLTMWVWWRDVIIESGRGDHNRVVQMGLRYGMILFISSEVMFFVGFFWAFFNASIFPSALIAFRWPPAGIETFDAFGIPFLNTMILLLSGCTVTWAHHGLRAGARDVLIKGLALTVVLGITFTLLQAYEYRHAAFGLKDGIYASTFYLATSFHGLHVIIGTIFLTVCLLRALRGHFTADHHVGFEAAAWYWHFVDVVWLFLFVCIYCWGSIPRSFA